jgi:hypothetical protein
MPLSYLPENRYGHDQAALFLIGAKNETISRDRFR